MDPIPYWIDGGADVAETTYTAFAGARQEVTCRPLVRRERPTPGSQLALHVVFDYHPILTDRPGEMLEVEADHRRHAVGRARSSQTSNTTPSWRTCPRGSSPPTPPGSP